MDKIVSVLEYMEDEDRSWADIRRYCRRIGLDPAHARGILTDPNNPLVIETDSRVRPNLNGHKMVDSSRKATTASQFSDNKIEARARDSGNMANIIGSGNTVTFPSAQEPVEVLPHSEGEYNLIAFGRWIMMRLFGTLNHDMKGYTGGTSVLTVLETVPLGLLFASSSSATIFLPKLYWELFLLIALLLTIILGWDVIIMSRHTRCPKCKERFRVRAEKKILKRSRELSDGEVRNYDVTYSCDKPGCNYKKKVNEVEKIPYENDDSE